MDSWRLAGLQLLFYTGLGYALAVNVRANDIVPGLGKASSGDKTNVPTTDDGKAQNELSCGYLLRAGPQAKRFLNRLL